MVIKVSVIVKYIVIHKNSKHGLISKQLYRMYFNKMCVYSYTYTLILLGGYAYQTMTN